MNQLYSTNTGRDILNDTGKDDATYALIYISGSINRIGLKNILMMIALHIQNRLNEHTARIYVTKNEIQLWAP